jgi:hypothetical protein
MNLPLGEQLFFGSVDVSFAVVPGKGFSSPDNAWKDNVTPEAKEQANARFQAASFLGEDYSKLVVPAIPATDFALDPLVSEYIFLSTTPISCRSG